MDRLYQTPLSDLSWKRHNWYTLGRTGLEVKIFCIRYGEIVYWEDGDEVKSAESLCRLLPAKCGPPRLRQIPKQYRLLHLSKNTNFQKHMDIILLSL
jgi:hypothetical protein